MQNQYNLLRRQDELELMATCGDMGAGLVPYSPNGKGRLARPAGEQSLRSRSDHVVQSFDSPHDEPVIEAVQQVADGRGVGGAAGRRRPGRPHGVKEPYINAGPSLF
ncbi:aldo/keto reductase [Streptomyces sp. NPDC048417]|uniref:aldo/keto reductase n=1 Tax=Streptomyces sp. NPDC048417 TaxID=3155387 RepID=UPI00342A09E8